ncbi:hypothetical protein [Thalassospira xiamenensis]|uniref:hypothetical protein n=1 Tax=Thalassospira xiamenensis TaxID=220697 RepID=UPI0011BFDF30|nr:hypothetical protein [Thalassospira xiamenensis]
MIDKRVAASRIPPASISPRNRIPTKGEEMIGSLLFKRLFPLKPFSIRDRQKRVWFIILCSICILSVPSIGLGNQNDLDEAGRCAVLFTYAGQKQLATRTVDSSRLLLEKDQTLTLKSFKATEQDMLSELENARGMFHGNPSRKEIAMFLIGKHNCHLATVTSYFEGLWHEIEKQGPKNSK